MQYGTYQFYTAKLKKKDATMSDAAEKMMQRREGKKKHYRFVTTDSPTGNPIFEFIKTKNRNNGCDEDFPDQHYESQKLIMIQ